MRPLTLIDTETFSAAMRHRGVDVPARRLLVSDLRGTEQERDLTVPANAEGVGRLRHFRRGGAAAWPANPLPIDPACRALGLPPADVIRAQVFQNAVCNWRCWYCFVPFKLLAGDLRSARWVTAGDLIDLYLAQPAPPPVIDLSGGQPDLVPEWVPWMMRALRERGLERTVYLWSDDNLSSDYFWRYLDAGDIDLIAEYENYGKVCCFKGMDPESFSFNTRAEPELFEHQFTLMSRLLNLGIDLYAYVTLTAPSDSDLAPRLRRFVDRLQEVDPYLPLRTVPLEVQVFTPVESRLRDIHRTSLEVQHRAIELWMEELHSRFSSTDRDLPITDVPLKSNRKGGQTPAGQGR